ncbi:hypothetical protein KBA41_05625 [Candidatus Ozemobacteraceae bacterium]|nr:hypothetical protein [Candidatus Ozemobacteraceae bacterium]
MPEPTMHLEIPGTGLKPGEELRGRAVWNLAAAPQKLEIRLFWYTRGRGTRDVGVVECQTIARPGITGEEAFTFHLPDGPYSFSGKLISVIWAVELVADEETVGERAEFILAPDRREILLGTPS